MRGAFDAADAVALCRAALADLPPHQWPTLCFQALPSAQLVPLEWAVEPAWHALNDAPEQDPPSLPEPATHTHTHTHSIPVWRPALECRWRAMAPHEQQLLTALFADASFGMLCDLLAQDTAPPETASVTAVRCLQQWLAEELLVGFAQT